jgi:hypothetical protein
MPSDRDQPNAMQKQQAFYDHVAARGHTALGTPMEKRTKRQIEDIKLMTDTFGEPAEETVKKADMRHAVEAAFGQNSGRARNASKP